MNLPLDAPRLRVNRVPLDEAVVVTSGCPSCGGDWLRSLLYQHLPDCELRAAEDARAAFDATFSARSFTRWASTAEITIGRALGVPEDDLADGVITVDSITMSVRRRVSIGSFALDRLCSPAEYETLRAATTPPRPANPTGDEGGGPSPVAPSPARTDVEALYGSGESDELDPDGTGRAQITRSAVAGSVLSGQNLLITQTDPESLVPPLTAPTSSPSACVGCGADLPSTRRANRRWCDNACRLRHTRANLKTEQKEAAA